MTCAFLLLSAFCFLPSAFSQAVIVSATGNCALSQAPLFNTTTGLYDCAASLPIDVTTVTFKDDFPNRPGANVDGELSWMERTVGAAPTISPTTGAWPNIGLLRILTPAVITQGGGIALDSSNVPFGALGSNANWDTEIIFRVNQTTGIRFRTGFVNGGCTTAAITSVAASCDGIWLRFDTYAPVAAAIANNGITRASGTVTVTTAAPHLMQLVGQSTTLAGATGCGTDPNGAQTVLSIPSATTFTFAQAGGDETCGGAGATSTPTAGTTYKVESKTGAASPTSTAVDTLQAADTNFHRLRIRSTSAGTILFTLYGPTGTVQMAETTVSTNVATTNMGAFVQVISDQAITAKSADVDFFAFQAKGLSR